LGEKRVYLSQLFSLISVMSTSAGDFMASRFRENVWPCIAKVVGKYVNRRQLLQVQKLSESENDLLVATMRCLFCVFNRWPLGRMLASLIPSAGVMIFPFLQDNDSPVALSCEHALYSMIRIDSDALWPLCIEMSGAGVPPLPISLRGSVAFSQKQQQIVASGQSHNNKLARAAMSLMDFIDALPEQSFD
jgi:hypothetical protein